MAKADYSRDYYADLELSPSAEVNDVKKQFRKLALKYHPDRNPGKEAEVNAKFQTIQAAHEILSNPEQKSKYDAQRRNRPGYASGVRGNPWQDVAAQYPAPPRRPGQAPTSAARNSRPPGGAGASSSSSSHRYSHFNVPPTAKKDSKEDIGARYHAWQNMKPKKAQPSQSASSAYNSGKKSSSGSRPASGAVPPMAPPPPPRRTASQRQKAEASFGSRRNQGFFPQSPIGDEPPAANTNNYSTSRASRKMFFDEPASAPQEPPRRPPPPPRSPANPPGSGGGGGDADNSDDAYFDTRQSTPYQTHGGEKFNPFDGVPISRTKSFRSPPSKDPKPGFRRRSSSLPDESDNVGGSSRRSSSRTRHDEEGDPRPNSSRTRSRTRPAGGSDYRHPTFEAAYNEKKKEEEQAKEAAFDHSGQNKSRPGIFSNLSFDDDVYHNTSSPSTPNLNEQQTYNFGTSSAEDISTNFATENPSKWRFNAGSADPESGGDSPTVRRSQSSGRLGRRSPGKDRSNSRSAATGTPGGSSYAHPSYPPPPPPKRPMSASGITEEGSGGSSSSSSGGGADVAEGARTNTFDAKKWSEQIGSEHFAPQYPPPAPPGPGIPPARPMKTPKPVHRSNTRTFTADDAESEDSSDETQPRKQHQQQPQQQAPQAPQQPQQPQRPKPEYIYVPDDYQSPNAMEIDSPPESPRVPPVGRKDEGAADQAAADANGARNVPVEPSRQEWRAGDVNTSTATSPSNPGAASAGVAAGAAAGAAAAAAAAAASNPNMGGSEDSEEFRTTFAEFRNVEPFAERAPGIMGNSGPGLGSFSDLRSNLPFESKASPQIPTSSSGSSSGRRRTIRFPKPPMAPNPPPVLAVPGLQPSAGAWEKYETEFRHYMAEWYQFDSMFVDHFQARRNEFELQRRQQQEQHGGNNFAWLSTRSDEGIKTYLECLEQDQEVRSQWASSAAAHAQNVRQFKEFRDRMK